MNIPVLSWIVMIFSLASVTIALAMLFLVLWQAPRHRENQLMALYMIEVVFWGISVFMARFWSASGQDATLFFYGIVLGIGYNGFFLFALASHYAGLWGRWWVKGALIALMLYSVVFVPMILSGQLYTDFSITAHGDLRVTYQPLGYLSFGVAYAFNVASLVVLWLFRKRRAGKVLFVGGMIVSIGVLTSVSKLLNPYSIAIMTAAMSAIFFAYAILKENLFNPLALLNEELTRTNSRLSHITEELHLTNQRLSEANRLKSQFLASMSHELRTPLNSIIGYTELLLQGIYGETSDIQRDRLEKVVRNGQHLLRLINDILDLSKIEAGHMTLKINETDVVSLIDECLSTLEPLAQKKNLKCIKNIDANLSYVMADRERLHQVVTNVLSNAVKFTNTGSITIYTGLLQTDNLPARVNLKSSNSWIRISIEDTGIGIAQENLEIIFDEFRQVDGSTTREYGGTGLGLAISRRLIEMMGGYIWSESALNEGSKFIILLPASAKESEQVAALYVPEG